MTDKKCEIRCGNRRFGTMHWHREGLKTVFEANSDVLYEGVYRSYAYSSEKPEKKHLIGVMEPDGASLSLKRSFSDYDIRLSGLDPEKIDSAEAVFCGFMNEIGKKTGERWNPFDTDENDIPDEIMSKVTESERLIMKSENGSLLIAEPIESDREIMFASMLAAAFPKRIGERLYAVFEVRNGRLVREKRVDTVLK